MWKLLLEAYMNCWEFAPSAVWDIFLYVQQGTISLRPLSGSQHL